MPTLLPAIPRRARRPRTPAELGLPDPRPVTGYTVAIATVMSHSRITVTLNQPCIIRSPAWPVIDVSNGAKIAPVGWSALSPTSFWLDYATVLNSNAAFIEVPYQDKEVQNYQGGFVQSGAKWFRSPV